jgi:hypothetical protein
MDRSPFVWEVIIGGDKLVFADERIGEIIGVF